MSTTKVMFCGCVQRFQDRVYGKQMRVHNLFVRQSGGWRCTGCARERTK